MESSNKVKSCFFDSSAGLNPLIGNVISWCILRVKLELEWADKWGQAISTWCALKAITWKNTEKMQNTGNLLLDWLIDAKTQKERTRPNQKSKFCNHPQFYQGRCAAGLCVGFTESDCWHEVSIQWIRSSAEMIRHPLLRYLHTITFANTTDANRHCSSMISVVGFILLPNNYHYGLYPLLLA